VYLKSVYKNDPHFSNAKVIYAHYKQEEKLKFSKDLPTKLDFDELPTSELNLNGLADVNKLHEIGIQWSDAVSHGTSEIDESLLELIKKTDKSVLEYHDEEQTVEAHENFYDKVLSENGVLV
jgi:starch synthase